MDSILLKGYYNDGIKNVKGDLDNIKKNYLALGYHLKQIKDMGWFRYKYAAECFDKFCKDEFGFSKSTFNRLIQIVDKFCLPDTYHLKDEYLNFSQSQLIEMLPFSDDDIVYVRPDMTIREIRSLKSYEVSVPNVDVPGQVSFSNATELFDNIIDNKNSLSDATSRQFDLLGDDCILAFYNNHFTRYPKDLVAKRIKDGLKDVLIDTYGPSQGGTLEGTDGFYECSSKGLNFWFTPGEKEIKYTWSAFISRLFLLLPSDDLDHVDVVATSEQEVEHPFIKCNQNSDFPCTITGASVVAKSLDIDCPGTCCWNCALDCGARCNPSAHNKPVEIKLPYLEQRKVDLFTLYHCTRREFDKFDCLPEPGKKKKFKFGDYEMTIELKGNLL